jgi:hypothetical protein
MNAIPLPLEEELALVEEAEPAPGADVVSIVDDLIEPEAQETPKTGR